MNQLFNDIKARLQTKVPELKFIQMYNNQFLQIEDGTVYAFPFPCVFIEFVNENEIKQLGGGYQIYDPLTIRVHIGQDYYDATDGTFEQNLAIFDLRTKVFRALQKFEPTGAVQFIRYSESQDYQHTNVYHYIQDYKTNYIEQAMKEPVDGIETTPPTDLDLTVNYNPIKPYTKEL